MDFNQLAQIALSKYGLSASNVAFIRHNENVAQRVTVGESSYLLRVHQPRSTNFESERQLPEMIDAELDWLEYLSDSTQLQLQKPIRNRMGERVTTIDVNGSQYHCTLLTWIEGRDFDQGQDCNPRRAAQISDLISVLHSCSKPPHPILRPKYDIAYFVNVLEKLRVSVDLRFLTSSDFNLLETVCNRIFVMLAEIEQEGTDWGLIHADLGPANLVIRESGVSPIDFSLCGYGPLLWDIGGMLVAYPLNLRKAIFEHYSKTNPLQQDHMRLYDGLAILSIISCWSFHISNPSEHEWLKRRIPKSVEGEWRKFLKGESFFLDL